MKVVAVSQRVDDYSERKERRDALDQNLVRFLLAAECLAMPVPNVLSRKAFDDWMERVHPEGVLLSGGNDPGVCPERDATENLLMEHAEWYLLPLLGVCRGMQMMGLGAGVCLEPVTEHARVRHELEGKIEGNVNSFHNFALLKCPERYSVLARSTDGVLEAIRHDVLPWEGWMWHPEREAVFSEQDVQRAGRLFRCLS